MGEPVLADLRLVLAFLHGANGARVVIGDYIAHPTAKRLLIGLLLAISGIWLVLGMAVIAFFDPTAHSVSGPL
jgi:succinate dehydrogenase / fumarate reductase membrane anchor subunit